MQIKQNIDNTVLQKSNYWVFLRGKKTKAKVGHYSVSSHLCCKIREGSNLGEGLFWFDAFQVALNIDLYWRMVPADVFLTTFVAAYERSVTVWPCKTFRKSAYIYIHTHFKLYIDVRVDPCLYFSWRHILYPKMCLSYIDPGDSLFMCW